MSRFSVSISDFDHTGSLNSPGPIADGHLASVAVLVALFAGIYVSDRAAAVAWYDRLLGQEPNFFPNDGEAVWELAENRSIYVKLVPAKAGSSAVTVFVDNLGERVAAIAARGLEPTTRETYDNGVSKVVYQDPDGNEIGFGGLAG